MDTTTDLPQWMRPGCIIRFREDAGPVDLWVVAESDNNLKSKPVKIRRMDGRNPVMRYTVADLEEEARPFWVQPGDYHLVRGEGGALEAAYVTRVGALENATGRMHGAKVEYETRNWASERVARGRQLWGHAMRSSPHPRSP